MVFVLRNCQFLKFLVSVPNGCHMFRGWPFVFTRKPLKVQTGYDKREYASMSVGDATLVPISYFAQRLLWDQASRESENSEVEPTTPNVAWPASQNEKISSLPSRLSREGLSQRQWANFLARKYQWQFPCSFTDWSTQILQCNGWLHGDFEGLSTWSRSKQKHCLSKLLSKKHKQLLVNSSLEYLPDVTDTPMCNQKTELNSPQTTTRNLSLLNCSIKPNINMPKFSFRFQNISQFSFCLFYQRNERLGMCFGEVLGA